VRLEDINAVHALRKNAENADPNGPASAGTSQLFSTPDDRD
jgi:hypothetical protein